MRYRIEPATIAHVRLMATVMREQDRAEITNMGLGVRETLLRLYRTSAVARAATVDGDLAAIWGLQGELLSDTGSPWLFTAPPIERARFAFAKETRREIAEMLQTRRRLTTGVLASYTQSTRFFEMLGFSISSPRLVENASAPYCQMTLERDASARSPFVILALPRSRTFWLSHFLTFGEWTCWHEQGRYLRTAADVRSWLAQDLTGTVETAVAPWWRLIRTYRPDARVALVRRPVSEVVDSIMRLDMRGTYSFERAALTGRMEALDRKLDQIERRLPNALSVPYSALEDEATCAGLFEHCLQRPHDPEWWRSLADENMQADMPSMARYMRANKPQLDRVAAECGLACSTLIRSGQTRKPRRRSDVLIQAECFDSFWRDGQALFAEHAAEVGGRRGVMLDPDVDLAKAIERAGGAQIVTARAGGRMVGYLVVLISPQVESAGMVSAMTNTFFVSKEFRGIGGRLISTAVRLLTVRGVDEAILRAGIRGDGPRLDALFKRLGASEFGRLYCLPLRGR